ncbi:MAG: hypothetical protein K6F69_03340, partial [Treponema sp.]|nr:hypothetical protein [Treponema sp.]
YYSLDFCKGIEAIIDAKSYKEFESLAEYSVEALNVSSDNVDLQKLSAVLYNSFSLFNSDAVRIATIDKLGELFDSKKLTNADINKDFADSMSSIKTFLLEGIENGNKATLAYGKTIAFLGKYGDKSAFETLFSCYEKDIWKEYKPLLESSLEGLVADSYKYIEEILAKDSVSRKLSVFRIATHNMTLMPDASYAELAEKSLVEAIYSAEDFSKVNSDIIDLQIESLKIIDKLNWTRSCDLVNRYFSLAQQEYEASLLSDEQFIVAIKCIEKLASLDSGQILSTYLNILNGKVEQNKNVSTPVALAVINALGNLGDKVAFDYLFNVQHLGYSEEIISAARDAMARLKL